MDEFFKSFGPPATSGEKQARLAATAGATSSPVKKAPQSKGGVQCAMCEHFHKPGNQCSYMKSVEGLFDINKSSPTVNIAGVKRAAPGPTAKMAAGGGGGGIPGHSGGNPNHGKDGRFTTSSAAVTATPAKGEPAVPVQKKGKARPIEAGKKPVKEGAKPAAEKAPKAAKTPGDKSKTSVLPAKPMEGWSQESSAKTSEFTPKTPVDRAGTAKELQSPGAGAGDNRKTRQDASPAGDADGRAKTQQRPAGPPPVPADAPAKTQKQNTVESLFDTGEDPADVDRAARGRMDAAAQGLKDYLSVKPSTASAGQATNNMKAPQPTVPGLRPRNRSQEPYLDNGEDNPGYTPNLGRSRYGGTNEGPESSGRLSPKQVEAQSPKVHADAYHAAVASGADDDSRTRVDTAPAGDKSSDSAKTVPGGLESLFDDIDTAPSGTGSKPLTESSLGGQQEGSATGAASPRGAKKKGRPPAGQEGGGGGVQAKGSQDKTSAGGSDEQAYLEARNKWYQAHPEDAGKTMPGSGTRQAAEKNHNNYKEMHESLPQQHADAWQSDAVGATPEEHASGRANVMAETKLALEFAEKNGIDPAKIRTDPTGMATLVDLAKWDAAGKPKKLPSYLQGGASPNLSAPAQGTPAGGIESLFDDVATDHPGSTPITDPAVGSPTGGVEGLFDEAQAPAVDASQPLSGDSFGSPPPALGQATGSGDDFDAPIPDGPSGIQFPQGTKQKTPVDPKANRGGGLPIAQLYGAGQGIGSGVAGSPGGGVAPAASFGVQRVHGLLNPNLDPGRGPALASPGQGAGRAAWTGSTGHTRGAPRK